MTPARFLNFLRTKKSNVSSMKKLALLFIQYRFSNIKYPSGYLNFRNDINLVMDSGLFDQGYYYSKNKNKSGTPINALSHFLIRGWKEGRNPNPLFDINFYLESNPDVKSAGVNPFIHYLQFGWKEGRNPHPLFDTTYYLESNHDVKESNINPLAHFILFGLKEGRNPFENYKLFQYQFNNLINECTDEHPFINYLKNHYNQVEFKRYQQHKVPTQTQKSDKSRIKSTKSSIVVVLHIYHVDQVDECIDYLKNIPFSFHIIVTTSLQKNNESILKINANFNDAEVVLCENAGRDIGAFIKIWPKVQQYDLCCKLHTKKGDSSYIELWRKLCLEGILCSSELVEEIVRQFEYDNSLALAGPELLYGSLNALIGINKTNIQFIASEFSIPLNHSVNNGFFMGTMFWMRTSNFAFISNLYNLIFPPETGRNEGAYEHAIERILGSATLQQNEKIILTRTNEANLVSYKIVNANFQSPIITFHKHFDSIEFSQKSLNNIIGFIDPSDEFEREMFGWIALTNDETPREAIIRIDHQLEIDVVGSNYREDLKLNGVNKGLHGFNFQLPFELIDEKSHTIQLIDKLSGKITHSTTFFKKRLSDFDIQRTYFEWDSEREKKLMKNLANINLKNGNYFNGLVSVIMPTYNRANYIENAISSVISQTYSNFELIIIDDDSNDETEQTIDKYKNDSRIKYFRQMKGGSGKARNKGLKESMGEYIFYLDTDNFWFENYLKTMLDYLISFNLDSVYSGLIAFDEKNQFMYYRGCDFSWPDFRHYNYIDLNSFGHKKIPLEENIFFDEKLERLVDWDYIMRFSFSRTISYAPFLGVKYDDGINPRITNTVRTKHSDLNDIITTIRNNQPLVNRPLNDMEFIFETMLEDFLYEPSAEKISVDTIIPTYNHEQFIAKTIESVLNQKGNIAHRIILSDDGSTDNTRQIIKYYKDLYPEFIIDLSSLNNIGISANFKRCIEASKADYIAICEGDDFWTDRYKLQKQINYLQENNDCSMVFSKIKVHNLNNNNARFLKRQISISKEKLDGDDFLAHPSMNLIANFSCCLFNSTSLKSLPPIIFEGRINEIAVAFHLEQQGKIGYINQTMSVYRQHTQGLWTGSDETEKIISGLNTRKMVLQVAHPKYKEKIQQIIDEKYLSPLTKLGYSL
jgi:glycosyltransferase involved in cell wall biosynthesis